MIITDTYRITDRHARHGHLFAVTIRLCDSPTDIWVDLETGAAWGPSGSEIPPLSAEVIASVRAEIGWRTPVTYVDNFDPETREWVVTAEPCYFCEQLKS